MSPANSIEIAIWTAVGGRGTLVGPDRRRGARERREELLHAVAFPEYWLYVLGAAVHPRDPVPPRRRRRIWRRWCEGAKMPSARDRRPRQAAAWSPPAEAPSAAGAATRATAARGRRTSTSRTASILYLEDISVSFDGFKALNKLSLAIDARRAALRHRPQRRRQDHDDGRDHRQDAARHRHASSSARPSTSRASTEAADRARRASGASSRSRRSSSSHTVFENLELAMKADKRVRRTLFARLTRRGARPHRRDAASASRLGRGADRPAGLLSPRPEAMARDRHAARCRSRELLLLDEPVAGHERRGDRAHRRALPVARRRALAGGGRARHGLHRAASRATVTVLHEGSVLAEGPLDDGAERPAASIEVYLGRDERCSC